MIWKAVMMRILRIMTFSFINGNSVLKLLTLRLSILVVLLCFIAFHHNGHTVSC